ncbi:type II toxin-antitoxin system RatA family toxin [Candidatus Accumulibacter phosphatis]|uniref:Type II toxin-antitoxin system RatA family toxin n=1 Tax=Candidatus Accumulibacter phosphatis TaxID=327160 RepID=A0ABX1U0K9_9PROT|nr:type II toxin-antitoxin system RatA family toxin [Candidatus Accumulibacter phosphatis]NMQ28717.1 type II toxin-antitoxin system RatA family toxin [Candidatus Accumulibacter phosphatis]
MATHRESRAIALAAEYLFDVVADVESYPQFVPLIADAKIVRREEAAYETEQSLALGLLLHRFRTRTELDRPHKISIRSNDRSFAHFDIRWAFTPFGDDRCHVDFALDCETRSFLLMPVIQLLVMPMAAGMVSAFEARARAQAAKSGGAASPDG